MLNGFIAVEVLPSLTMICTPVNVPALPSGGVPASRPVVASNVAQLGLLLISNVSLSPSGSLAVGWKLYGKVTFAVVTGVPEMVGARLVGVGVGVGVVVGGGVVPVPGGVGVLSAVFSPSLLQPARLVPSTIASASVASFEPVNPIAFPLMPMLPVPNS